MKDPTAKAVARNVAGLDRAARLDYLEADGRPARLWLDQVTLRRLARLVAEFTDDDGERHIRFNEKAVHLLEQVDRRERNQLS